MDELEDLFLEELEGVVSEELGFSVEELEGFESEDFAIEELETGGLELEDVAIEELETEALDVGFVTVIVPVAVALLSVPSTMIVKT